MTVSIHASHAGCDTLHLRDGIGRVSFNPRIPCGMRRSYASGCRCNGHSFNPRIPCGMRPRQAAEALVHNLSFNPRIPCGMRLEREDGFAYYTEFQSTHPMRDATAIELKTLSKLGTFQSTHPMRDATRAVRIAGCQRSTFQSTHPMRDATPRNRPCWMQSRSFNPRIPCGMRLSLAAILSIS